MSCIYNTTELFNLQAVKEATHWYSQKFISGEQLAAIRAKYPSKLYHPNLAIRILLFIISSIAISGGTGLFFLMFNAVSESVIGVLSLLLGAGMLFFVRVIFVENSHHFRSGVVEAGAYCACGFIVGGLGLITDGNEHTVFLAAMAVCAYMSYRFLDLICHAIGILVLAGFIFYEAYQLGGVFRQIIPFLIIIAFSATYFLARALKKKENLSLWLDNLRLTEMISLMLVYTGGNYLVVRECSIEMLGMNLQPGEDIPFAVVFYAFTAGMPLLIIYRGIKLGSIMLIRIGVIMFALSVMTFRYYFSIAPPEVALTIAGMAILGLALWLFDFLKTPRGVFTRDKLLSRQFISSNVAAFAVSQTMGGNVVKQDDSFKGGGGSFGGGGASGDF